MMEKQPKELAGDRFGLFIISNAIVWGAVMVVTAFMLKGSGYMQRISPLLSGGAVICVIFLPMMLLRKRGCDKTDDQSDEGSV
jgi:hypothetical protein